MHKFNLKETVFYDNPGHPWDKMTFVVDSIEGIYINSQYVTIYNLKYGTRELKVHEDQIRSINMTVQEYVEFFMPSGEVKREIVNHLSGSSSCNHKNKVKSHAGGNSFWYCRDCKEEVL